METNYLKLNNNEIIYSEVYIPKEKRKQKPAATTEKATKPALKAVSLTVLQRRIPCIK